MTNDKIPACRHLSLQYYLSALSVLSGSILSNPRNPRNPRLIFSYMPGRDTLEVDVLIVGGGPAGLAAAYHLRQLMKDASIAVLEKGKEIGAHILSGAVMDPRGLTELMPDWLQRGAPLFRPVDDDRVLYLTRNRHFKLPITCTRSGGAPMAMTRCASRSVCIRNRLTRRSMGRRNGVTSR